MAVWSTIRVSETQRCFGRLDSEFYKPEFLENDRAISALSPLPLRHVISKIDVGHVGPMVSHYSEDGILFLQTQNIKPFFIDLTHSVRIDRGFHEQLSKSMVRKENVLLARSGSFGTASIYLDNEVINAADIIIVDLAKKGGVSPFYLVAFMNSKYGVGQLLRFASGGLQGHVNLRILESFKVPMIEPRHQEEIKKAITNAYDAHQKSAAAYASAQALLSSALKENELKFDKPLSYTARFSDVMREGRADAEFFHAKYQPILNLIEHFPSGFDRLGDISRKVEGNFVPGKYRGDVNYTEIGDVNILNGRYTYSVFDASALPANAKIKLRGGELLISTVRPTRGAIAIVDDNLPDGANVCSGAFYVCDIEDKSRREVIWLYLRIVKCLFEKYCGGTSYPTIDATYLRDFPIPRFDQQLSDEVKRLIQKSKEAAITSESLLAAAKARVEELIESAVQSKV